MDGNTRPDNVVPLRRKRSPCPICGRPSVAEARPFCSRRCADKDLLRWLRADYRIETDEAPADAGGDPEA